MRGTNIFESSLTILARLKLFVGGRDGVLGIFTNYPCETYEAVAAGNAAVGNLH